MREELMLVKLKQRGEMEKIEVVERRKTRPELTPKAEKLRGRLMLLMNLNLPGLRKRCR